MEAAATDMESCGGWLHPEFDMEELVLNAGFGSVSDVEPMLAMLESLRDEDGLGLVARMPDGRVGIPPLLLHLSEHLAKKQKRTTGDWIPFSVVLPQNSGVSPENSNTLTESGDGSPENGPQKPVLKERKGKENEGKERTTRPRADAALYRWEDFADIYPTTGMTYDSAAKNWWTKNVSSGDDVMVDSILAGVRRWNACSWHQQGIVANCGKFLREGAYLKPTPDDAKKTKQAAAQDDIFAGCENLR